MWRGRAVKQRQFLPQKVAASRLGQTFGLLVVQIDDQYDGAGRGDPGLQDADKARLDRTQDRLRGISNNRAGPPDQTGPVIGDQLCTAVDHLKRKRGFAPTCGTTDQHRATLKGDTAGMDDQIGFRPDMRRAHGASDRKAHNKPRAQRL